MNVASSVPRGVARSIDLAVQIGVLELTGFASTWLPVRSLIPMGDQALLAVDLAVGLGAMIAYTGLSEWYGGATLGKHILGLRVVDAEGGALTPRAVILRNLALLVDLLFFGIVAHSSMSRTELRQRVGDLWAGTLVVHDRDGSSRALKGWLLGLTSALALVMGSYVLV